MSGTFRTCSNFPKWFSIVNEMGLGEGVVCGRLQYLNMCSMTCIFAERIIKHGKYLTVLLGFI